ncbi:MAG: hypothetical protein QME71_08425 [Dehalococcoidia bacterium]|nr:hypothetical protein [Dehalococcoidia bacterium]
MSKTTPTRKKTLRLVEKSDERPQETRRARADRRQLEDVVAAVFARWRGHEPEVAILSATTFILAIAAIFAGADILFTLLVVAVAAVAVWSPWRRPR